MSPSSSRRAAVSAAVGLGLGSLMQGTRLRRPGGRASGGGVGDGVGGIKDRSAAAADVVVIVPSPQNAKKTVLTVAAVVVAAAAAAAARTVEVCVGYPVNRR